MYLGIDLGTTNVKAVVVEESGRIAATGASAVESFHTPDDGVEQDVEQIWRAARASIRQAVAATDAKAIRSIGVSSQGGAVQLLDGEDRPIGRVISWLDGRGRPFDLELCRELGAEYLAEHIGYPSSTMTLGQVLRIRHAAPALLKRPNRLGFVGDVIVGRLCGRRAHDPTSLGIGMLYNPWLGQADPQILARLGLGVEQLPDLLPAATVAGRLRDDVAAELGLAPGMPVSPAIHDQYAAALGTGATEPGRVVFGSGTAWVLLATTSRLARPVARTAFVCRHPVDELFGQMIPLGTGGSAIQWIMNTLSQTVTSRVEIDRIVDGIAPGSAGLQFWPVLHRGPVSDADVPRSGRLDGLTMMHQPAHMIRAVVEGLACELARHVRLLAEAGFASDTLLMCGSAAASRTTPQIVADTAGVPVACVDLPDVSAFGAAMIARRLCDAGVSLAEVARQWTPTCRTVTPGPNAALYRPLLERYLTAFSSPGSET